MKNNTPDYSAFDLPQVTSLLFHPRPDYTDVPASGNSQDILIPVGDGVFVGARFHPAGESQPVILFFHGNGEIVADYDDLAPLYNQLGINFFPVDYRGYGRSTGYPTVSAMMNDCHPVFSFIRTWLKEKGYTGPLIVMGRSLGSACALEIASRYSDEVDGLIIESGFAYALPLLRLLGINTSALGLREEDFGNREKIKRFSGPTLIIHAEYDHIIPFTDGEALHESSPAAHLRFLKISGANHNTIFAYGLHEYMKAVKDLAGIIGG